MKLQLLFEALQTSNQETRKIIKNLVSFFFDFLVFKLFNRLRQHWEEGSKGLKL